MRVVSLMIVVLAIASFASAAQVFGTAPDGTPVAFFDDFENYDNGELVAVSQASGDAGYWVNDQDKDADMTVSDGLAQITTSAEAHQYQTRPENGNYPSEGYLSMMARYDGDGGNDLTNGYYKVRGYKDVTQHGPHSSGWGSAANGEEFGTQWIDLALYKGYDQSSASEVRIDAGDWHRIVYYLNADTGDQALWIDPTTGDYMPDLSEADLTSDGNTESNPWAGINLWAFGNQGLWSMDEIALVPEPATMALLGLGGLGVLIRKRR